MCIKDEAFSFMFSYSYGELLHTIVDNVRKY